MKTLIKSVRDGADIAFSSRWMPQSRIKAAQPPIRRILGRVFYCLIHALLLPNVYDTNCGLKAYRAPVAYVLFGFVHSWRWAFNVEHLWLAQRCGYVLVEVPVQWSHCDGSRVHVFRDCFFTLWEIFWLKVRQVLGLYPEILG